MNLNIAVDKIYRLLRLVFCIIACVSIIFSQCKGQELPIKPTRTISFETTEASYIDVDLSPDGNTIVFDILGDIYTVPVKGGTAIQLTRGMAYNRYPIWSPDGSRIAFMSDASGANHVNVMNADGSEQRALAATDAQVAHSDSYAEGMPAWTPDGNYVAVDGHLYHLAGGSIALPLKIRLAVQFSPDGNFLYFEDNDYSSRDLQRYNRLTGLVTKIATLPQYHTDIAISPDGQWLAYVKGPDLESSSLRIQNLLTGEDRSIAPLIEGHRRVFKERFTFTADSRTVVIGFGGKLHRIDVQSGMDQIIPFIVNVKADLGTLNYNTYRLTHDSLAVKYTRSANASPNGKQLVFSALSKLYVMDLPAGIPHPLVEQSVGQFQPVYSQDGKWIAYVSWSDTEGGQLWRIPARGGRPQQLTHSSGIYEHPAWSPDGQRIAVLKDSSTADHGQYSITLCQLQLISVATGLVTKIADSVPWQKNDLSFTSDGQRLLFTPGIVRKQGDSLYYCLVSVVAMNGQDRRVLAVASFNELINTAYPPGVSQLCMSPDMRYVVYGIREDLYLLPLANLGERAVLNTRSGAFPIIRFAQGGMDPHWEKGGKTLSWSYGNKFYRIDPDKIVAAAVRTAQDSAKAGKIGIYDGGLFPLTVIPDETITIQLNAPRHYAKGTIALRNVRILSMKGGEIIEHGTILIINGKFSALGPMATMPIPVGTKIIDLSGKTVMPGLIDLHDHMHTPVDIFSQQAWQYLANLAFGVTTGRDPSSSFDSFGYGELLETGQMLGPRLFTVGPPVTHDFDALNTLKDAKELVRKRAALGAVTVKQYLQNTRLQKQWLLMASREAGLNMTNEGEGEMIEADLAMIKDGSSGVEHQPVWGNVFNDITTFVARSGTWHTPTLQIQYPRGGTGVFHFFNEYWQQSVPKLNRFWPSNEVSNLMKSYKAPADSAHPYFVYISSVEAAIRHQGGHVTMGSHGNYEGIGAHWELWALQEGGLTNMEALQAATINGAEGLGMQQDLGSIEPGKFADLIVLDKNPLDDIKNTLSIKYVMKDGILYDGNTLDEMWPIKKKLPEWQYKQQITNHN